MGIPQQHSRLLRRTPIAVELLCINDREVCGVCLYLCGFVCALTTARVSRPKLCPPSACVPPFAHLTRPAHRSVLSHGLPSSDWNTVTNTSLSISKAPAHDTAESEGPRATMSGAEDATLSPRTRASLSFAERLAAMLRSEAVRSDAILERDSEDEGAWTRTDSAPACCVQ
jgi:hypothetical protein